MKRCPKCDTWKDESEFNKDKNTKSGLYGWCKKCRTAATMAYSQTPAGIASKKRFRQSELGRKRAIERSREFRKSDKYKAIKQRYNQSAKGKETARRAYEIAKTSGKIKARKALNDAIFAGKFPPAKSFKCHFNNQECSQKIDYHHYKGYAPENYFDVIPLCRRHHARVDMGEMALNI